MELLIPNTEMKSGRLFTAATQNLTAVVVSIKKSFNPAGIESENDMLTYMLRYITKSDSESILKRGNVLKWLSPP